MCDRVLQSSHNLGGRSLKVGLKTPAQQKPSVIEVSGFDSSMKEDILTMYFENPTKSGGGEIQSCKIDWSTNTADIRFTDHAGTLKTTPMKEQNNCPEGGW